jgi:hypothetical protein
MLLDELIYVFVERTYYPYVKDHGPEEAALLGALEGACRERDCLKNLLVRAVGRRLLSGACAPGMDCGEGRRKKADPDVELFADRLAEYEGLRGRYRSLDEFYPRLFELPSPSERERAASARVSAEPPSGLGGRPRSAPR